MLLAFLGDGHSHKISPYPEFKRACRKAITFLKKAQHDDGSIGYGEKANSNRSIEGATKYERIFAPKGCGKPNPANKRGKRRLSSPNSRNSQNRPVRPCFVS